MPKSKQTIHTATIVDETTLFTLQEISEACGIQTELVIELIEYGVIEPIGNKRDEWQFTAIALHRSQQALRLQQDLDINLPGIALVLELLDELKELRAKMQRLE